MKWFKPEGELGLAEAGSLQALYESGELLVIAPTLLILELLNAAARGWRWDSDGLAEFAAGLDRLRFRFVQPGIESVARWTAAGLTAYDACYVAVAEEQGAFLVTADEQMLRLGGTWVRSLEQAARELGG